MLKERKNNGQFAPGNPGGPGRPKRAAEADYLTALTTSVTLEDWHQIVTRAVTDAKQGDARARDWLARYLIGDQPLVELTNLAPSQIVLHVPDNGRAISHGDVDADSEQ